MAIRPEPVETAPVFAEAPPLPEVARVAEPVPGPADRPMALAEPVERQSVPAVPIVPASPAAVPTADRELVAAATAPVTATEPGRPTQDPGRGPVDGSRVAPEGLDAGLRPTCTTAQLRRFIKSRPWVPMHELRRRFGIIGTEDDMTPIHVGSVRVFIGMPPAEGRMMGELLAGGDVGYELSLDPEAPVVVGVYPMRPVPRS